MSVHLASTRSAPSPSPDLLQAVAERLTPLFVDASDSRDIARIFATQSIESYNPQTHDDYAIIGCILALSLAALSALNRATEPDVSPDLQLGYLDKVKSLTQPAMQWEQTLEQSRNAATCRPQAASMAKTSPEEKALILAVVDEAIAEFQALQLPAMHRTRRSGARQAQPLIFPVRIDNTLC